jgi:hypothetical protein
MAELATEDRQRIWRGLQRYWSNLWQEWAGDTPSSDELLTTVNETDTWIDDNQGSYNSALTYAGSFTTTQKTLIFCAVALMRVSPGLADLLRRALGVEVD